MQFGFGQFAPDAMETAAGALMICDGVLPLVEGYGPAPELATPVDAEALPDDPRGLISMFQRDGTNVVYAFTADSAYELDNSYQWNEVGPGTFALPLGYDWSTLQYGTKLLATNTIDGLQQYDIEVPAGFSEIEEAGKPEAIFTCANAVVALNCIDNGGNRDNRLIRTSAFGNQTNFKKTGADYQQVEDGGRLVGGIDLRNSSGLIFQDSAMRLIDFSSGGAGQFSLRKISDGRGAVGRRSIIGLDGVAYWPSTDGFKSYSLEGGLKHIGAGRIDDWFYGLVDQSLLETVQGAFDPFNQLAVWRFRSLQAPSDSVTDDMLGYSPQFDKWFTWTEQTTYLGRISTPGFTLDGMDSFGPLDGIDIPLDSRFWQGGQPVFAALDENRKYATFSGNNYAATFRTATSNSPFTGLIGSITPITDDPLATVRLGVKSMLGEALEWKDAKPIGRGGIVNLRGRGKNIAFEVNHLAGSTWSYDKGLDHVKAQVNGGPK